MNIFFKITIGISAVFITSSFAFSINDTINDAISDNITDSFANSFGLPAFKVNCDTGIDNINLYSYCSIFNKLDSTLGSGFKIGSCTISAADPLTCQRNSLKSFCQSLISKGEDEEGNFRSSIVNSIASSSEEILGTGGKIIGDFANCNYVEDAFSTNKLQSGMTLKEVYEETGMPVVKKHGLFNSLTEDIRDCMKVTDDKTKCLNVDSWSIPKTVEEAERDTSTVSQQSMSNISAYIKGTVETESQISKDLLNQCSNSLAASSCAENVLKNSEHIKQRDSAIASIETSSAVRKKIMEKAARTSKSVVQRSSDVIDSLPVQYRAFYNSAVARANASDIVIENLYSTNVNLEKEIVMILDNKMVDSSEAFMQKTSNLKIKTLLEE